MASPLDEATASLARVQSADPTLLARTQDLGGSNFSAAVEPAKRLINLFNSLPLSILGELPTPNLQQVTNNANSTWSLFEQLRTFNIESGNLGQFRNQIVNQLNEGYNAAWQTLAPYIGYAAARAGDFDRLEREGRAAVQNVTDQGASLLTEFTKLREQANAALVAAQRAASEQGVSQQAVYFRDEAALHATSAAQWQSRTTWLAISLGVYAFATLFLHKVALLKPVNNFESAQLITSKVLIFAVLSYMLILAAKNFLSHQHNAIVNRHRQNALMTFNALASAAKDEAAKDIVLTHAAACIFAPQETGYAKSGTQEGSLAQAMAGLLAKGEAKGG